MSKRLDQPTGADEQGDHQARTRARDIAQDEGISNLQALQRALYRSAKQDPTRRFHALYDKLTRGDVMWQAWVNVATNHGAPGIDGVSIDSIEAGGTDGVRTFLDSLAAEVKAQSYRPQPLRRVNIPKAGKSGETRPLGIPALADRVLMSAAKLVLEPIFEADFSPASFGFRPKRSAHDALEVIRKSANAGAHWVLDADIKSCFDEIDQDALMALIERRVCDRAMLKLLRSWLRAGIIEGGVYSDVSSGTPQGSPISPLLCNIALHVLDEELTKASRQTGKLIRFADDWVNHMCESVKWPGRYYLQKWPSERAMASIRAKVREMTQRRFTGSSLDAVVDRLNPVLRGWAGYFRHGNSSKKFAIVNSYVHQRMAILASNKHGLSGRNWATQFNYGWFTSLGIYRLSGTVDYRTAHALG